MDIKEAEIYLNKILDKKNEYGFEDLQATFSGGSSMEISVLNGEVNSYERSAEQDVSVKGKKNGQVATSGTNEFTDEQIGKVLNAVSENCELLEDEDEDFIYCDPENSNLYCSQITDAYKKNTYSRFENTALKLEKDILALDPCIESVDYLSMSCDRSYSMKLNTKGLRAYKDSDFVSIYAGARARKDGVVKTGGHYWYGNDIDKFDEGEFLKVFGRKLLGKFGASSVKSGTYDVVLGNEAVNSFFNVFMSNFSSYAMLKGLSLLAGKEGEMIASEALSLKEEPMYEKAIKKVPFDYEGVATTSKYIIEKGRFNTAFYNLKTANMCGKKSTGNGFAGGLSCSNMIIEEGTKNFAELLKTVGNGLYITELNGLHAGVNTMSGDFSLFCEGYLIENGELKRPVEQITISDNYFEVLKKISDVGNDTISTPDTVGEFFTPSVIIREVSIAGKDEE